MSANIHTSLSSQVKKLLSGAGIKVRTYSELSSKVNFTFEALTHQAYLTDSMANKKALHLEDMNLIAVDDAALNSTEEANELVLHELVHLATKKLDKTYEGEAGEETEECVAQVGMFKLILVLGLNPAWYADSTLEYIKGFPKADFKKVEIDSDKVVEYLVNWNPNDL
jgi:hypothetical protein